MDGQQLEKPLVANASDPKQVKKAETKERLGQRQQDDDLRWVMSTPAGRRFLWSMMSDCKTFAPVWESSARIHYNAGQQDIGMGIFRNIMRLEPETFLKMKREQEGVI